MENKIILYIKETQEFIINGLTIKESSLTLEEANELKRTAKNSQLIVGQITESSAQLII